MTYNVGLSGTERKCPVCGKTFMHYEGWVYNSGTLKTQKVCCSYKCLQISKERESPKIERRQNIIQALRDGLTVREAALLLGEEHAKVWYWKRKLEAEENERTAGSQAGSETDSGAGIHEQTEQG